MIKPRVRFLCEITFQNPEQKTKLLTLYSEKFFLLVKEIKSKKYFALDYKYLPQIRELLNKTKNTEELMGKISNKIPEANLFKLLEISPLFNVSPINLQAFILLGLGLREF